MQDNAIYWESFLEYAKEWWPAVSLFCFTMLIRFVAKFLITRSMRIILPKFKDFLGLTDVEQDVQDFTKSFYRPIMAFLLVAAIFGFCSLSPIASLNSHVLLDRLIRCAFIICAGWAVYNLTDVNKGIFAHRFKTTTQDYNPAIAKLAAVVIHAVVVLLCLAMLAQEWNFNISAFIASLGIGSLAVALAAKDTLANAFGGLSILLDQPFYEGNWIKVNGIEGIVEKITYRNTAIRTFDNEIIYMPNSLLTNVPITNYSRRQKRRIFYSLGLTYSTTTEQMRKIVSDIRTYIESNQDFTAADTKEADKPDYEINFYDFGDSALIIRISLYTKTTNFIAYLKTREEFNLALMEIIERNNASCAFPSTSVYFENELATEQSGWTQLTAQQAHERLKKN